MQMKQGRVAMNATTALLRRRFLRLLAGTALTAAWPAWGGPGSGTPLRIGLSLGLTGPYAHDSEMQLLAYRLWVDELNGRGGLLGRGVELVVRDDLSDPARARELYENLIARDRVDLLLSPFSSPITFAIAPVIERHGFPLLAAGAASDEIWKQGYRYIFATIPPASRQTIGFLALLAEARITNLAIVHTDNVYATALAGGTQKWATEFGIHIVSIQKTAAPAGDFEGAATAAREAGAAALLMAGHFDESIAMRRALKHIGWKPAAFLATVGPTLDQYAAALEGDEEGVLATSTWEPTAALPMRGSPTFIRAFKARFERPPSFIAAQAYAAGQVLEAAVRRSNSLDRTVLRDTLARLDHETVIGRFVVDQTGMLTRRNALIIQWRKGRREVVWPPEVRTAYPELG